MMIIKNNQQGITQLELLITLGLLGMLIVGFTTLSQAMNGQSQSQGHYQDSFQNTTKVISLLKNHVEKSILLEVGNTPNIIDPADVSPGSRALKITVRSMDVATSNPIDIEFLYEFYLDCRTLAQRTPGQAAIPCVWMTNVSSGEVKRFEHVQPMKWCQANVPDALTDGCDQLDNSHLPVTSGTVGTSAALSDSRNRFLLDYTMVSAFSIKGSIKLKNFQTVLLLNNVNPDGTPKPILNIVL